MPRPPHHVTYTKTVYYSSGRHPRRKVWSWSLLGAGPLAALLFFKTPILAVLIAGVAFWYWRERNGRRR